MNILFSIAAVSIIATIICLILKDKNPELAMVVSIVCVILIFTVSLKNIMPAIQTIKSLANKSYINQEYIQIMLKALGVCYVTELASDSCKEAGQVSIASKVELCGKVFIVILSIPIFQKLLNIAISLMEGSIK
ncbi:MAG: SpoIIIAC/SpoIIIAD family protein [Oscillospiraceae bacterium]